MSTRNPNFSLRSVKADEYSEVLVKFSCTQRQYSKSIGFAVLTMFELIRYLRPRASSNQ